jgi:hypothetical protein
MGIPESLPSASLLTGKGGTDMNTQGCLEDEVIRQMPNNQQFINETAEAPVAGRKLREA